MQEEKALDVAMLLDRFGRDLPRDADGMYVCIDTVPPTILTPQEYERGLALLDYRHQVRNGVSPR